MWKEGCEKRCLSVGGITGFSKKIGGCGHSSGRVLREIPKIDINKFKHNLKLSPLPLAQAQKIVFGPKTSFHPRKK